MYISAVKGAAMRRDDEAVMARLAHCPGDQAERPTFLGLMNELGEVCRLIICASETEQRRVMEAFREMGFAEKNLRGTGYQDLADAIYWKA